MSNSRGAAILVDKMEDIQKEFEALRAEVEDAMHRLQIDSLNVQRQKLQKEMALPDFWGDSQAAQEKSKRHARLESKVVPWLSLSRKVHDNLQLAQSHDDELLSELKREALQLREQLDSMKGQLKLSGAYDDSTAILTLHAGAGGTDAQDWTQMLLRMYVRWAEAHDYAVHMLEESSGDEAGIKSATIEIDGSYAYGKLQSEHGVHRLVRLSPFNSDNLRQTSFAMVEVVPKIDTPDKVTIDEKDLKIDVYRSGGKGGQSVNTTDSAVRVTHIPTGIVVSIQNERSQLQNKETALTILRSKLAHLQAQQHVEKLEELRGPNISAEWGNQIRSYVLHPYKQVKDNRTSFQSSDPEAVLDGDIDPFIETYLDYAIGE